MTFKIILQYWDKEECIQSDMVKKLLLENKACKSNQIEIVRRNDANVENHEEEEK